MGSFQLGNSGYVAMLTGYYYPTRFARSVSLQTGYQFPAIPTAVSICFWIRARGNFQDGTNQTMFDNRDLNTPTAYLYNATNPLGFTATRVSANPNLGPTCLTLMNTGGWVKVYLECAMSNKFYIGKRYTGADWLAQYDLAEVRVYSRVWTLAEQKEGFGVGPSDSIAARYDFIGTTATTVPDVQTGAYPATIIGATPTIF